jgi:hypothetical protein
MTTKFYNYEGAFGQYVEDAWINYSSSGGEKDFEEWFEEKEHILFEDYTTSEVKND